MVNESIKLSIVPKGENPVFYMSQYETSRDVIIELVDAEGNDYSPDSGVTAELHVRKVDDTISIITASSITNNVIVFHSNEQLTACSGDNKSELWLINSDDTTLGTLNFIIRVERSPIEGGIDSQSDIENLTTQITSMCESACASILPEIAGPIVAEVSQQYANRYGGRWYSFYPPLSSSVDHANITVLGNISGSLVDFYVDNETTFKILNITNVEWSYNSSNNTTTITVYYDPNTVIDGSYMWLRVYSFD